MIDGRVAVLVGIGPNLPPVLDRMCLDNLGRMKEACPEVELFVDRRVVSGTLDDHLPRLGPLSRSRNMMVDSFVDLNRHSHVLMIDADVIQYPPTLPRLLAEHAGCVAGTTTLLEGRPGRWFDTAGYLEMAGGRLRRARALWPHFAQPGPIIELESVGMLYMMPSDVFRHGRYSAPPDNIGAKGTDHYSICQHAKGMGYRVIADLRVVAVHALWKKYGGRQRARFKRNTGQPDPS